MKALTKLGEAQDNDGALWELWERDGILSLLRDGVSCSSSFTHGADDAMVDVAIAPIVRANQPFIMIAGLGLAYSLARLSESVKREKAKFIIAEPVAEIVTWNRNFGENKDLFVHDNRIEVEIAHAAELCRKRTGSLHAILLKHTHDRLRLSLSDAQAYFNALKGGSMLVIAIAKTDKPLEALLRKAGFDVSYSHVPAATKGKQMRMHTLILARRGRFVSFNKA